MIYILKELSRRRRFFGGGFLYRVLDFGMSGGDFTVPVHAALRICFTPQTLLFLHSIFMSSSSPFFCATLRPRAPPGSGRNLVLHFVQKYQNWTKLPALICTCRFQNAVSQRVLRVVGSDFTGKSTRGGSFVFW